MKKKKIDQNSALAQVKAARKVSRDEEIKLHGKPVNFKNITKSKKKYNRKRNKATADEAEPYFFIQIE